jgi:hypothetical protein
VEAKGLEPSNLLTASQALYQLSYAPEGVPHYQHSTGRRPNRSGTVQGRVPDPVVSQGAPWRVGPPYSVRRVHTSVTRGLGLRAVATDAAPIAICMPFGGRRAVLEPGELTGCRMLLIGSVSE